MPNNLHPSSSASSTSVLDSKEVNLTHNRNVSLDSSLSNIKGLNTLSLNNENPNVPSFVSPGAHSNITYNDEGLSLTSVLKSSTSGSKSGANSRGSSPSSFHSRITSGKISRQWSLPAIALRKKLSVELSGSSLSGAKRRSPVVSRKGPLTLSDQSSSTISPSVRLKIPHNSNIEDDLQIMEDKDLLETKPGSSVSFNGSTDVVVVGLDSNTTPLRTNVEGDDLDCSGILLSPPNQLQKTKEILDQLQCKIQKTAQLIEQEQRVRDENVNEYLKLSTDADKHQLARIKTVFEKKNQKSATNIQHLQKKLENYRRKRKEVEQHGAIAHRQPKEVLRDVGHGLKSVGGNIRDGISSTGKGLIGKPKEIAYLIKNKFGSADNIKELGEDEDRSHHGSATLPPNSGLHPTTSSIQLSSKTPIGSATMGSSGGGGGSSGGGKLGSNDGASDCNSSITSESISGGVTNPLMTHFASSHDHGMTNFDGPISNSYMDNVMQELKDRQEESSRLREEIEMIKQTLSAEVNHMYESLMEEKIRYERLEEQVNDLTELHQNEMENLKSSVKDLENMEEKVQYKNEENIKDLYEMVEGCQAKISRMEHQQAQQQQQFLTLEGLENSNARMLIVKLINILLTVLQVLLLIVATAAGILTPLLQTKARIMTTAAILIFCIFLYLQLVEIRGCWHSFVVKISRYFT